MQGWRRLQQSIPGAGENVAGSQAILSQPLLASFRKDWRVTRLDSSYWRGCKGSQAVIFRFYTPQLLCPFFFFLYYKKKSSQLGWLLPPKTTWLPSSYILVRTIILSHPPFLCSADSLQTWLSPTQQTEEHTIYASAWSVLLRPEEFVEHLAQQELNFDRCFQLIVEHLTKKCAFCLC